MRYEPRSWGKNAIGFILKNARVALWATPGIGKTGITFASILLLRKKNLIKGALVVAPLNVVHNTWPAERQKWEQFHGLTLRMLHGPTKLAQLLDPEPADIYLINFEGLPWLVKTMNDRGMWKNEKQPFDMLVIDESSKVKNPSSQRFKIFKGMSEYFRRVLELTGSPAPNGLKDVWSQVYLLDDGAALGRFKTHFYMTYFSQVGYGGYELVLKPGADTAIYDGIKHLVLRMDAADYLDMPELIVNDIIVELDPPLMKQYRELENKLLLTLEDVTVSPTNAAAAVGKCLQFCNGAVYDDNGSDIHEIHSAKLDALADLIDELAGQPLLVLYHYKFDARRLSERFGEGASAVIQGGMSSNEVASIIDRWNKNKIAILFAGVSVVSHGLNLQLGGACNMAFFGLPWDREVYEQAIARLYRQGQANSVFVHRLLCKGTIDVEVANALHQKDLTQRALLDAMKARR